MCPPGLAFASVSERTWARVTPRTFYFDWPATQKAQRNLDATFTPAVSLLRGLDVALGMLLGAGLEAAFERHVRLGRAARAGVKAMGLELFSPDDDSSAVVTAISMPEGIDSDELLKHLRDQHGVTLAPGQGQLKGKAVRIGHIGWFDVFDIVTALAALELVADRARRGCRARSGRRSAFEAFEQPVLAAREGTRPRADRRGRHRAASRAGSRSTWTPSRRSRRSSATTTR